MDSYAWCKSSIGGVKQLYRLAEALSSMGANVSIVQGTNTFRPYG